MAESLKKCQITNIKRNAKPMHNGHVSRCQIVVLNDNRFQFSMKILTIELLSTRQPVMFYKVSCEC